MGPPFVSASHRASVSVNSSNVKLDSGDIRVGFWLRTESQWASRGAKEEPKVGSDRRMPYPGSSEEGSQACCNWARTHGPQAPSVWVL